MVDEDIGIDAFPRAVLDEELMSICLPTRSNFPEEVSAGIMNISVAVKIDEYPRQRCEQVYKRFGSTPRAYFAGTNFIAPEFMQYRNPVGLGPSSKTCPRWPPQREQFTSTRTIPTERSVRSITRSFARG